MTPSTLTGTYTPVDFDRLDIYRLYEWVTNRPVDTNRLSKTSVLVLCPSIDHAESDPSCKLTAGENLWYCYGCKRGGKHIELVIAAGKHAGHLTGGTTERVAAIRWIREQLNIPHEPPTGVQPKSQRSARAGHRLNNEYVTAIHQYRNADGSAAYFIPRIKGTRDNGQLDKRFEYYRATDYRPFRHEHTLEQRVYVDRERRPLYTLIAIAGRTRDLKGVRYEIINTKRTPYLPRHVEIKPGDHPSLLYRLPDVVAAAAAGGLIVLPEGENKADSLTAAGFVASSAPFGANGRLDPAWRPYFVGASMLLVPADADEAGRRAAITRAEFFAETADVVAAIDPFPDRTDGYDVTNFIDELHARGHSMSAIHTIVEECFRTALLAKGLDLP